MSGVLTLLEVIRDGEVVERRENIPNMLTNAVLDTNTNAAHYHDRVFLSTDDSPNKESIGTYSQNGTTITRDSGSFDFTVDTMVGDNIKFDSGDRALITSITSATEVEVHEEYSRTLAAQPATIYYTGHNITGGEQYTDNETHLDSGFNTDTFTTYQEREWNFGTAGSDYDIHSVIVSRKEGSVYLTAARVLLDTPVSVSTGDQVRLRHKIEQTLDTSMQYPIVYSESPFVGYPFQYASSNIESDGTHLTITTPEDHHYEAGDTVEITESVPTQWSINSIVPDGSKWLITTSEDHDLLATNTVTIADCSVAAYNGTWTVDASPSASTLEVLNVTSPAAASNGLVAVTTPGTYYDGTYTVLDAPTSNTFRVVDSFNSYIGTCTNSTPDGCRVLSIGGINQGLGGLTVKMNAHFGGRWAFYNASGLLFVPEGEEYDISSEDFNYDPGIGHSSGTNVSFSNMYVHSTVSNNFTLTSRWLVPITMTSSRFKQILIVNYKTVYSIITFDHIQSKPDGYEFEILAKTKLTQQLN